MHLLFLNAIKRSALLLLCLFFVHSTMAQCEVDAGENISICAGESAVLGGAPTIVASGANAQLDWSGGVGNAANPTVSPNTTTIYTVTLTDDDGCQTTDQITITVFPNPTADFDFNPSGACSSSPVQFVNNSSGSGLEYEWNFGNPASGADNTSTANNPQHQFVAPGNGNQSFTVTLTATDVNGCSSTTTETVPVIQSPSALLTDANIFTPFVMCGSSGQNTFDITVQNASTTQATNVNYSIDWGDGSPTWSGSTFTDLSHTYTGTGFFEIAFTVEGANGCSITEIYEAFSGSNPSVGLASPGSTINLCAPNELVFPITNTDNNSLGTQYTVTFGDGSAPVTFMHPPPASISHSFETSSCGNTSVGGFANSFDVRIVASNPCGFSSATIEPIQTSSAPTADVSVFPGTEGCSNSPFTFTNVSTNANFNNNGNCISLMTADWSIEPATGWTLTNGSLSDPDSFSATFDPGEYTITMVGANPCGDDVVTIDICVTPPPEALFTIDPIEGCTPLVVPTENFSSSLNNCDNETYLWQVSPATGWNFSSGNATSVEPEFTFTQPGSYTITMTVTNVCGSDQFTQNVTVFAPPTAEINPMADACEGANVLPQAIYTNGGTPITSYSWSFPGGNPSSANTANPGTVTYDAAGNYTVTVTVTNACGSFTDSESFTIEEAPVISVLPNDPEICQNQSVTLTASGANSYSWSPSTGLNTTVGSAVTANPSSTTTYTVTGTSAAGCSSQESVTVTVNPLPTVTSNGPFEFCQGACETLSVSVNGGQAPYTSYAWSPSTGLDDPNSPTPEACPNTSQNYTVIVTDANGCQGSGTVSVTVNPLPVVNAGPDISICNQPVAEQLTGFSPLGGSWSGPIVTPEGSFTPNGTGDFELTYTFVDANGCENSDDLTVSVIDPQVADAGPDLDFCANAGEQLIVPVTAGGSWSGTGVAADGTFTPGVPGNYVLTYSIGGGSCATTDQISVEVYPVPIADAGLDVGICEGLDVNLSGTANGGTLPYQSVSWNASPSLADPADLNTLASPSATETFTLSVTDANGCSTSDEVEVEVFPATAVDAGGDLVLCNQPIPEELTGFGPLPGMGESAEWSGDNVTPDGIFTPGGTGDFTLTYTFTNANGCISEDSMVVAVLDPTDADAGDDFAICLGSDPVQLASPGNWSGAQVSPSGLFDPQSVGSFDLLFTIGTGTCETSDNLTVEVLALPTIDAGVDLSICDESTVTLNPTAASTNGSIISYTWTGNDLSDPTIATPVASPSVTSLYTLTVVDEAGCSASDELTVEVSDLPVVNAGADLELCDQAIEEVLTGFSPTNGQWAGEGIVDDSGIFLSPGEGVYTLTYTYTDAGGCVNSDVLEVTVVAPQVADAGDDLAWCLNAGGLQLEGFSPLNASWSGNGITDAGGFFDPLEAGVGVHELLLEFGSGTCYSSDVMEVEVLPLPQISTPLDPVFCGNVGLSDLGDFSPLGGTWEGDGIADAATGVFDPSIANGNAGEYEVFYWYTDPMTGCADTSEVTVSVSPVPNAAFSIDPEACTNGPLEISNSSSGANDYLWVWGNGEESTGLEPVYTFPQPGTFTVELTVENTFGCIDNVSSELEVIDPPQAGIATTPNEGCAPLEVSFENLSLGDYLSYEWDLDSSSSTDFEPEAVTYQQGDDVVVYTVSLTATNYCGSDLAETEVTVFPQPIAGFGTDYDAFCSPWPVAINNTSVGNPDTYVWDWGDGTTSSEEQPGSHTYFTGEEPSEYTITLTTENECGIDSYSYTITVLPNTVTAFFNTNLTEGCSPLTVEFTDFSTGGNVVAYDFGDDNVSNLANPTHTFTEAGIYEIAQFVNNGCSFDTTYAQIEVFESPVPAFSFEQDDVCAGAEILFTNLSEDVNNVNWDFGDGNLSNVTNPTHTYEEGGSYVVTIQVTSETNECIGSTSQTVTVFDAPDASFSIPEQVGCSPFEVTFTENGSGGAFYEWDFGNGESANGGVVTQTFTNDGATPVLYNVTLTSTSMQLCSSSFTFDVIVSPTPVSAFTLSQTESCSFPISVQTSNASLFATGYNWDFGVFGGSQLLNPSFEVDAVGTWPISLTASNAFGCTNTSTEEVVIHPLPVVDFTSDVNDGCIPLTVNFQNLSEGGLSYEWFFSNGASSTAENPQVNFTQAGFYDAVLVVETNAGCTDTLMVDDQVVAYPLPEAYFEHTPEVMSIYSPIVSFTDLSAGASNWFWNFGDGYTSTETNPVHAYSNPGTYSIELLVRNGFSCESRYNGTVTITDAFNVYVPNAFSPDADNVNDVFFPVIVGKELVGDYELTIFDRWGVEVFKTEDMDAVWLGDFRGGTHYVQNDVYLWQIKYRLNGAEDSDRITGHVLLIR